MKAGQWNTLSVRLSETAVTFVLNGAQIYEHELAAMDHRMFGFFRYKNRTAAEVRRVVLTGNWPEQLSAEQLAHPTVQRRTESAENKRSRESLVDDSWFRLQAQ